VTASIPPELLAPEDRPMRVAELEGLLAREWVRYVIVESVALLVPALVVGALYATSAISNGTLVGSVVLIAIVDGLLTVYWVQWHIRPLSTELERLRSFDGEPV
jgi:hypothetical protein